VVRWVCLGFPELETVCGDCKDLGINDEGDTCETCDGSGKIPTPEGIKIIKLVTHHVQNDTSIWNEPQGMRDLGPGESYRL